MIKLIKALIGSQFKRDAANVNWKINRYRYVSDVEQYGANEYPADIRVSGFGDCEDYAIAKVAEMRALGYRATLARTFDHAVCIADGGEDALLVMDNMKRRPYKYVELKPLANGQQVIMCCPWDADYPAGERIHYSENYSSLSPASLS